MEVWLGIAITVVLVVIIEIVARRRGWEDPETRMEKELEKRIRSYHYPETLQQTRQRGTPEQERGSDDTG